MCEGVCECSSWADIVDMYSAYCVCVDICFLESVLPQVPFVQWPADLGIAGL